MGKSLIHQGFITGQLLVAMPSMRDPRFTRTVIYMCAHTTDGAMGLVINRLVVSLSSDYVDDATLRVGDAVGLTATLDILRDIASGQGPKRSLLALGYAGWGPGQLDSEIQANAWLCVPADEELIFDDKLTDKWERSIEKIGIDFRLLSGQIGNA